MTKDSENSDVDAELEKACISRIKLFQENNTEFQNVIECAYCGGDFVNKIHLKFCQMALKHVVEQTCLICDSESDSPHDAIKHVREHHLNVICEFIESENKIEQLSDPNKVTPISKFYHYISSEKIDCKIRRTFSIEEKIYEKGC